jgi:carbon-monoxide dehydrogenase medium subunit/6-hydroxypseudooxynicotine dehydrogenase subunit alpha
VKPPPFAYARAESAEEAVSLLAEHGDDAKVIAGGQSLVPLLNFRLARPSVLVDVTPIAELDYVRNGDGLAVGALCRHAELERLDAIGAWQALAEAVPLIGHYPIRARGTAGGSVAHADPSAELPLLCAAYDAEIDALGPQGKRTIEAAQFFRGTFATALRPDELLLEVRFPAPPAGTRSAFEEFSERAGDFALASVCAVVGDGSARLALGGVGPTPLRATEAERVLAQGAPAGEVAELAARECDPAGDFHASAEFRRELVAELTRRALARLS